MTIRSYPNGKHRAIFRQKGKDEISQTFDTLEEAQNFLANLKNQKYLQKAHIAANSIQPELFSISVQKYLNSSTFLFKREGTQKREKGAAKAVLKHFANFYDVQITTADIQDYLNLRATQPSYYNDNKTIRSDKVSWETIRLEKAFLRSVYDVLNITTNTHRSINYNPIRGQKLLIGNLSQEYDVISDDDLALILSTHPKFKDQDTFVNWFFITLQTAMRSGESSRIKLSYYQRVDKAFKLPALSQKSKKTHYVNISDDLIWRVEEQVEKARAAGSEYLFFSINKKGQPVPFNYSYYWRKIKQEAGIKHKLKPHQLRHTAITELVKHSGLDQAQVMAVSGHSSPQAFSRYVHLFAGKYRDEVIETNNKLGKKITNTWLAAENKKLIAAGLPPVPILE